MIGRLQQPRTSSACGFTLVEMLVVMAIFGTMVALLLPAIQQARNSAELTVCAARQRQIGSAELFYMADNSRVLPVFDNWSSGYVGQLYTNTAWQSIYVNYLNLPIKGGSVANSMRFLPHNSVFQCPSKVRTDSSRGAFMMAAGSADDLRMTEDRLFRAFTRLNLARYGPAPALLGERSVVADNAPGGVFRTESNHWNVAANRTAGGNTFYIDGSARWNGYTANASTVNSYVSNGAIFNLQAWPSTALFFSTDNTGNIDPRGGGPNAQAGPNWTYSSLF